MKNLILVFLLFFTLLSSAQDLDIYKHQKNSNFVLPVIPPEMTYTEFKILSTDLRMQDMLIAMILPGHVHFKIDEKRTGYYLLGARSLGYAGWFYLSAKNNSLIKILLLDNAGLNGNLSTGDLVVAYGSLGLIIGSYLYDWIHGRYVLEDKQNRIRYKYAKQKIKLSLNPVKGKYKTYMGLSIAYKF